MNECPVCGNELEMTTEEQNGTKRTSKKCHKCGFESVEYDIKESE
ncbi:hypothetical protein [Geoglobus acetivorans]